MPNSSTTRDIVTYIKEVTQSRYVDPSDMKLLVEEWKEQQKLMESPYQNQLSLEIA